MADIFTNHLPVTAGKCAACAEIMVLCADGYCPDCCDAAEHGHCPDCGASDHWNWDGHGDYDA